MHDDKRGPGSKAMQDEPVLARFTGWVTNTPDPVQASRLADVFLLFQAAGGTVLGAMLATSSFLFFFAPTLRRLAGFVACSFQWVLVVLLAAR
jgi:hypothetical protein